MESDAGHPGLGKRGVHNAGNLRIVSEVKAHSGGLLLLATVCMNAASTKLR